MLKKRGRVTYEFSTGKTNLMLYFPPLPVWLDAFLQIDGGCSSGVEPRFVVPVVAGSNPVSHPISPFRNRSGSWDSPDLAFGIVAIPKSHGLTRNSYRL